MRHLSLDYARADRPHPLGYGLLIVASVAVAALISYHATLTEDIAQARAALQKLEAPRRQSTREVQRQDKEIELRLQNAQMVLSQLGVPWDQLFRAFESVAEDDVGLLGISPDAAKKEIKLAAEAKNMEAMLAYHRKLAENPAFTDVSLATHNVAEQDPQQPVRFTVTATWVIASNAPR